MKAYINTAHLLLNSVKSDKLYMNALYGMGSTAVVAFFGFFYWLLSAHLYSDQEVGLATTLVSSMMLLVHMSSLGFDSALIRFLPKSLKKNETINSSFLMSVLAGLFTATLFTLSLSLFAPKLLFIRDNGFFVLFFITGVAAASLGYIVDNTFQAFRSAHFILIRNALFSSLRLVFPLLFLPLGAFGIFLSWVTALLISLIVSYVLLKKHFSYSFEAQINIPVIREMASFSFYNYLLGFLGLLPALVLPLFITSLISPEASAYFYVSMMIGNMLFVLPFAATQSLFAEGSHDEKELVLHLKKALKIIAITLLPAMLVTILFGNIILQFFGKEYSSEGFRFLQFLAASGIFVAGNYIGLTLLNIKRRMKTLLVINVIGAGTIVTLSLLFIDQGLVGIGYAWIIGQGLMNILYIITYFILRRPQDKPSEYD